MASGHVNRAERSNTWPHRTNVAFVNKTLANLGTVHTRPFSTFALTQQFVCNWGQTGLVIDRSDRSGQT